MIEISILTWQTISSFSTDHDKATLSWSASRAAKCWPSQSDKRASAVSRTWLGRFGAGRGLMERSSTKSQKLLPKKLVAHITSKSFEENILISFIFVSIFWKVFIATDLTEENWPPLLWVSFWGAIQSWSFWSSVSNNFHEIWI